MVPEYSIPPKKVIQEEIAAQEQIDILEERALQEQTATYKGTIVPEKPTPSCPSGVFPAHKKDGTPYYRSSITYRGKHISLGSYQNAHTAHSAYLLASRLLNEKNTPLAGCTVDDHPSLGGELPFEKWVCLLNFRDNGIYCHTPIYLQNRFFLYYLALFVSDYGMQVSILSRYGIHSHAVAGRDYRFVNGDPLDYRYSNIEIINHYHGVTKRLHRGHDIFTARIHINGNYLIGRYLSEAEAAIAYNKAADYLNKKGFVKNYPRNYIEELSEREYAKLYAAIRIGRKIRDYPDKINLSCN